MSEGPVDLESVRAARSKAANTPPTVFEPGAALVEVARMIVAKELTPSEIVVVTREPVKDEPGAFRVRVFSGAVSSDRHTMLGILDDAHSIVSREGRR